MLTCFLKDESGATAVEYGLIAALVSVASIVGLRILGDEIGDTFNYITCQMTGADAGTCRSTTKTRTADQITDQDQDFDVQ